jgi:diketogulonate reductase-like aldo/keto reductase
MVHHLEYLLPRSEIIPTINQVEWHPWLQLPKLVRFCRKHSIQLQAWAPLIEGQGLTIPTIVEMGKKYGKSPAQVIIRWDLQRKVVTIPKSVTPARIQENAEVFDFELAPEDVAAINTLDENKRMFADPDYFDF